MQSPIATEAYNQAVSEASPDKRLEVIHEFIKSQNRWDLISLSCIFATVVVYVTPLSLVLQGIYGVGQTVSRINTQTAQAIDDGMKYWAPDLQATPHKGEKIAGYEVTSPWGNRDIDVPGASKFHRGVDLGAPSGTPLYALGNPNESVTVECFWDDKGGGQVARYYVPSLNKGFEYLHLTKGACASGSQKAGSVIARSGNTGIGAPHIHIGQLLPKGQSNEYGGKVPPAKGYVWWAVSGQRPQPLLVQGSK
jgi:murein DD-endopeptidase MepM/ murein hydrolase activator NlpD